MEGNARSVLQASTSKTKVLQRVRIVCRAPILLFPGPCQMPRAQPVLRYLLPKLGREALLVTAIADTLDPISGHAYRAPWASIRLKREVRCALLVPPMLPPPRAVSLSCSVCAIKVIPASTVGRAYRVPLGLLRMKSAIQHALPSG
jgi:hypothetical protein